MKMEREISNARISGTMLGVEDHGVLSCWLTFDFGGSGQGFGGYGLDRFDRETEARVGTAYGMEFIRKILEVLDVKQWGDLTGTSCRVDRSWDHIHGIGHYLEDKWFYPETQLEELRLSSFLKGKPKQ